MVKHTVDGWLDGRQRESALSRASRRSGDSDVDTVISLYWQRDQSLNPGPAKLKEGGSAEGSRRGDQPSRAPKPEDRSHSSTSTGSCTGIQEAAPVRAGATRTAQKNDARRHNHPSVWLTPFEPHCPFLRSWDTPNLPVPLSLTGCSLSCKTRSNFSFLTFPYPCPTHTHAHTCAHVPLSITTRCFAIIIPQPETTQFLHLPT